MGIIEFYTFSCILDWDNASSLNNKKILLQLCIMIFISVLRVILTRSMNECSQENRDPLDYGKKTFKYWYLFLFSTYINFEIRL